MISVDNYNGKYTMGVQEYLNTLLNDELKEIKYRYREKIVADIKDRMCSLLSRWDDEEFRKTILFVTDEEALFYEPDAPADHKRFVVATIRNSMLEVAASVSCTQFKMQEYLSDETVRAITSGAISYFKECDFHILQDEIKDMDYTDVYQEAIQKYPLAWEVLKEAALMEEESVLFEKMQSAVSPDTDRAPVRVEVKKVICDGYTLEFDDALREELGKVESGISNTFYVDCFKMVSRNFEKVLHVLQIIFEHDGIFLTCNYYISNGIVEKRKRILRAAHNFEKELYNNMRNKKGLPARMRAALGKLTEEETCDLSLG